jgi:hypothetical protein
MEDIPDYVSMDRMVEVSVQLPDGSKKNFNSSYEHVVFIDVRDGGVWIRTEDNVNLFYPSSRILELKMSSSRETIPEDLQKQRRQ